jgi:hypothetical protein
VSVGNTIYGLETLLESGMSEIFEGYAAIEILLAEQRFFDGLVLSRLSISGQGPSVSTNG